MRIVDRVGLLLVATGLFTLALVALTAVLGSVRFDFNEARLTPTFALVHGYRLYYPATDGPILSTVYGPVSAFAYLPATVFRTPTPAIITASALQVLFLFAPMIAFVWRASWPGGERRVLGLSCAVAACLVMTRYPGTWYWVSTIEPDAPALALGLLACMPLVSRDGTPPTTCALASSATAAVLAGWAKQVEGPLVVGLAVAVGLAHGRRLALRYTLLAAGIGVAVSALFLAWFGAPMVFNMFVLLARQPWYRPGVTGVAAQLWQIVHGVWDLLAVVAVALVAACLAARGPTPVLQRAWVPPLCAAAALVPIGAVSANKLGAHENSFHAVYFLIAAAATLLVDGGLARAGRLLAYAVCALAIVAAWRSGHLDLRTPRPRLWQNDAELAYDFAVRHPGEAYFPWHPLASLLAEGRLYHFDYALIDRFLGGYEPTIAHVRGYVPPRMRWIAARGRVWTLHYFPEYSQETTLPELPGWTVLMRPP